MTFPRGLIDQRFSGAFVRKSTDQTNIGTSEVKVTWNTTVWDTDSYFDDANDRFTVPSPGYYRVTAMIAFDESTNDHITKIRLDGSDVNLSVGRSDSDDFWANGSSIIRMTASQYVEIWAAGQTTTDVRADYSFFQIEKLGV